MKKNYLRLLFLIVLSVLLLNCSDDDTLSPEAKAQRINERVNTFVGNKMDSLYLWKDMLPDMRNFTLEPKIFFEKLLYTREDKWSFITDDYEGLMASFAGTEKSFGFSVALGTDEDSGITFAVIQYVNPGTAAAKAGLKRGDVIYQLDEEFTNAGNINKLFTEDKINITYGNFINGQMVPKDTINLVATEFTTDAILINKTIEKEGKKIGYLCFTKFISNEEGRARIDEVFENFKTEGITDLVLDLRYNRGGSVTTAQHLCSSIAPENVVTQNKLLINQTYNDLVQKDLEDSGDTELFELKFKSVANNINMTNIYVLTGPASASASELTIVGLKPYMNVNLIGAKTAGKYAASITVRPTEKDINNWAIQPIILKYANAEGLTDFRYGLAPDFEVADDISSTIQLGDENEALLKKAIEEITGAVSPVASSSLKSAKKTSSFKVIKEISSKYDRFYNTTNFNDIILRN